MKIVKSPNPQKKYRAVFSDGTHTDFGDPNYQDYTQHKNKLRRQLYLNRHKSRENWNDPKSPGALSRYILWGDSTDINENIRMFKRLFNLT